jgi:hypothetical protein
MHLMLYAFNAMTKLCHGQAGLAGLSSRFDPLVRGESRSASGPCILAVRGYSVNMPEMPGTLTIAP